MCSMKLDADFFFASVELYVDQHEKRRHLSHMQVSTAQISLHNGVGWEWVSLFERTKKSSQTGMPITELMTVFGTKMILL